MNSFQSPLPSDSPDTEDSPKVEIWVQPQLTLPELIAQHALRSSGQEQIDDLERAMEAFQSYTFK
jgi:hypothetical protein